VEAKPSAAAKVAPGGKGMSMEDILAAARGKKPAGAAAPAAKAEAAPAAKLAPVAKPAAAPAKVAPGGKGMSMEEILAMARGKKAATSASVASAAEAPAEDPVSSVEEAPAEEPAAAAPAAPAAAEGSHKSLKDQITTVAEQVAYCRKVDHK
jgi:ribonuclease E